MKVVIRGTIAVGLLSVFLTIFSAPYTYATMPGQNGAITFSSTRESWLDYEVYKMNPDGSDRRRLSLYPGNDYAPVWSPDGTKIVFYTLNRNSNLGELYVMNADGTNQTRLMVSGNPAAPSWSPDGTKITYYSVVSGSINIYSINADGTNQTRLTTVVDGDYWPTWSPDGTKIAFHSRRDNINNVEIYIMNADGTNQTRLTNTVNGVQDAYADFSPDGTKIAFTSNRSGFFEIYTMDINGSNVQKLTTLTPSSTSAAPVPKWSPDGTKIIFSAQVGTNLAGNIYRIFVMNTDGSNITPLTPADGISSVYPSWQPLTQPYVPTTPASAPSILSFSSLGQHPSASTQPTALGKRISDIAIFDGKLYPSYGDGNDNHGPVNVELYDLTTRAYTGNLLTLQSELLAPFRKLDGKYYTLSYDPMGASGTIGVSSDSATWSNSNPITARHLFDIQSYGGALFLGIAQGSAGSILRSTDGGASWTTSLTQTSAYTTNVRFYWLLPYNGKLYAQNSAPSAPLMAYDGTSWTNVTTNLATYTSERPVVFANRMVSRLNGMSTFDGTTVNKVTSFTGWVRDIYVDGSYLYVLRGNDNSIARTTDLATWEELGSAPSDAYSLAVYNNRVYIGAQNALIYESDPISTALSNYYSQPAVGQPTLAPTGDGLPVIYAIAGLLGVVGMLAALAAGQQRKRSAR